MRNCAPSLRDAHRRIIDDSQPPRRSRRDENRPIEHLGGIAPCAHQVASASIASQRVV